MSEWNPLPPEDPRLTEQFRKLSQARHDAIVDQIIDEAYSNERKPRRQKKK